MTAPTLSRKYCEDCRFCEPDPQFPARMRFARCHAPQNKVSETGDHLVSRSLKSEVTWRIEYCSAQRGPLGTGTCGPDADWFEPKQGEQVAA